jgi:hypothetical protein
MSNYGNSFPSKTSFFLTRPLIPFNRTGCLFFTRLFVPLPVAEGTFARKNKRKMVFSFVFHSLIRTFAAITKQ